MMGFEPSERYPKFYSLKKEASMTMRQVVIDIPEQILIAEKVDEISFAHEMCVLSAVKLL